MTFTIHHAEPILDLIGKHESRGSYNIVWAGIPKSLRPEKLTALTVAQIINWQTNIRNRGIASTAAGKYQIISGTLRNIVAQMRFDTSRLFDERAQDEMACHLLTGRGFQKFLDGEISQTQMALNLAKEWASFPVPSSGRSYYAGDGLNKAHASVSEVMAALSACQQRYMSKNPAKPNTSPEHVRESAIPGFVIGAAIIVVAVVIVLLKS